MAERHPHDLKFTIFSLSRMLWVTDKPSNLDKPSRRFACDTLWVRPINPHPLDPLPTLTIHTWFKSMEHQAVYLRQGTEISPKPCARSARLCRPFCRVALSLHCFSALPNRPPSIPPSQPCVAIVHQAGHSPRSPRAARSLTPTSVRLSRPLGINFINAIDSAIMTRFLNLSHAMTINTGLNGITPAATLRFFFIIAANSYWDKVVIPAALDLWIWALFFLCEVFFAHVITCFYFFDGF